MPDELKGDRSFHEVLRRLGVQNPGEMRIQNPVVLTVAADDLTYLQRPVQRRDYWWYFSGGAVPGNRTGMMLHVRGGGIWIEAHHHNSGNRVDYWVTTTPPAVANQTAMTPVRLTGVQEESTAVTAWDLVANWNFPATGTDFVGLSASTSMGTWVTKTYIAPGRTLMGIMQADNQFIQVAMHIIEVPRSG